MLRLREEPRGPGTTDMHALRFRTLVLALTLALPLTSACSGSKLQAVETPAAGVKLEYKLLAGSVLDGHVHHKRQDGATGGSQSTRRLDFDVRLTVRGQREADSATHVQATISNIDLNWVVPNAPMNIGEFVANSKKRLEGMNVDMFVDAKGELVEFPDPPAELSDEDKFLMEAILDGLEQAFYIVPDRALKKGETWDDEKKRGRKGKLGRFYEEKSSSSFDGLFLADTPDGAPEQTVAQIRVNSTRMETITTKAGGHETKTVDKKRIYFDTGANYLAGVEGTRTKYDAGVPSTVKFRCDWKLTTTGSGTAPAPAPEVAPEPAPEPAPKPTTCPAGEEDCEVQGALDPCDDDYVGGADCTDTCSSNYMGDEPCEKKEDEPEAKAE
jgi:hypothetical protein